MNHSIESIKITIYKTQGCLVVPIQEELSKKAALQIQSSLLEKVHAESVKGVIIDFSGVKVIDSILWEVFSKTVQMVKLLGSPSVITGLSPGVAVSIIDLNSDINNLTTAMNLEDGLKILSQSIETVMDDEHDAENLENNTVFEKETGKGVDNEDT